LEIAFKLADDQGLLLLDLDDLRALLTFAADNRKEISTQYGLVSTQSVAASSGHCCRWSGRAGRPYSASLLWN